MRRLTGAPPPSSPNLTPRHARTRPVRRHIVTTRAAVPGDRSGLRGRCLTVLAVIRSFPGLAGGYAQLMVGVRDLRVDGQAPGTGR
jgi:hypothetical protein